MPTKNKVKNLIKRVNIVRLFNLLKHLNKNAFLEIYYYKAGLIKTLNKISGNIINTLVYNLIIKELFNIGILFYCLALYIARN